MADAQRDVATLKALLERVERASGPDRELDAAIRDALYEPAKRGAWRPYTGSLDASLALVEEMLPGCNLPLALLEALLQALIADQERSLISQETTNG
jgi:hypothetical protein